MHMVAGDREAAQFVTGAIEVVQRIAQDPLGSGLPQNTRPRAGIQPALYPFMEQLVVSFQE